MSMILAIAVGGAAGAVARHFVSGWTMGLTGGGFPYGTLLVNVLGCFLMGWLIEYLALRGHLPGEVRAMLAVGFLGAFTTFSAFALDVALLQGRGALGPAFVYVLVSVVGALGGLFAAMALARKVLQ